MDITTLSQLVGSLGFPILACCALFYYIQKQQTAHKVEITELTQTFTEMKDEMTTALNNNTLVLQRFIDKLEQESEDEKNA